MTKVILPAQNVNVDTPTGVDPVWYDKFKTLFDKVNSLEAFFNAGGYASGSYVPVLTAASGGTPPDFNSPALSAYWVQMGDVIFVSVSGANGAGGTPGAGSQQLSVTLPFPIRAQALPAKIMLGSFQNGTTEDLVFGTFLPSTATVPLFQQNISGSKADQVPLTGANFNSPQRGVYWRFFYGVD